MPDFHGCKVFTATMSRDREAFGERITAWLRQTGYEPVEACVQQSSDAAFHCMTIVIFYRIPWQK